MTTDLITWSVPTQTCMGWISVMSLHHQGITLTTQPTFHSNINVSVLTRLTETWYWHDQWWCGAGFWSSGGCAVSLIWSTLVSTCPQLATATTSNRQCYTTNYCDHWCITAQPTTAWSVLCLPGEYQSESAVGSNSTNICPMCHVVFLLWFIHGQNNFVSRHIGF